jgi:hypothetical protein
MVVWSFQTRSCRYCRVSTPSGVLKVNLVRSLFIHSTPFCITHCMKSVVEPWSGAYE